MKNQYDKLMKKCITLAKKGEGKVSPNPLVGAVVLDKNGKIAGYGWHKKYGTAHAEVNALNMAKEKAQGGTIIVSLEPCSHYGKTPPCADLIIKKGIKKLIAGTLDPNPKVSGAGIKKCEKAGIEVITGVLEKECQKLNEIFFKNQNENKPFVSIKTAITTDGKIASNTGDSKWITSEKSRKLVHQLRNKYDAIMTGSKTVLADNPFMTARLIPGRSPVRILVDSTLSCPPDVNFYKNDGIKIYTAVSQNTDEKKLDEYPAYIEFIKCPLKNGKIDLHFLFAELYKKGIYSILVEAGAGLNGALIKENLADKIYIFTAPKILGDKNAKNWIEGLNIEKIENSVKLEYSTVKFLNPDIFTEAYLIRY